MDRVGTPLNEERQQALVIVNEAKAFELITRPSGRFLEPGVGPMVATPKSRSFFANASISGGCAAHVMRRGVVNALSIVTCGTANGLNAGCL